MPTLHWVGKEKVVNHHREVPFKTLRQLYRFDAPAGTPANSTGNRIIHGDNLEALKALLPEYEGRVKCIYIDPPYNTGNEGWVYNDNVNDPKIKKWLGQVVGKEGEDLSRHDKWLCMMYPRLKLLHRLLAENGIIFVSVDNYEHRYLELILEEIWGATNFIETIIWKKSYGGGAKSKHIVNLHEYVVCYAKNKDLIGVLELPPDEKALKYYKYRDDKFETRGPYRLQPLATNSMDERPNLRYAIPYRGVEIWPEKQWQWAKERAFAALENDELVITQKGGKWTVSYKQYLKSENGDERASKAYSIVDQIYTQQGTNEIKDMFGDGKAFSFPKPSELIAHLLNLVTQNDDLILDSFAGSGTMAHAVLKLNQQDGGNRKFILVEMMDYAETITAERVRRVMSGHGEGAKAVAGLGGSFGFYEMGESLFLPDGNLNESVGVEEIRRYVAYTEGVKPAERAEPKTKPNGKLSRYLLGMAGETAVIFYYEPNRATKLDSKFLAALKFKPASAIIYADLCLLDAKFLKRHNIIFKKIPREVRKF